MRNFNKSLIHYLSAEIITKSLPVLLLPWVALHLGAEEFGSYALFSILTNLFTILTLLGVDQSVFRFLPEKSADEQKRMLGTSLFIIFITAVLNIAVFYIFREYLNNALFENDANIRFFDLPLITFLLAVDSLLLTALKAKRRTAPYAVIFILRMITFWGVFIYGILYLKDSRSYIYAFYLSSLITLAVILPLFYGKVSLPRRIDFKPILVFGIPMLGTIITGILLNQADHYMIKYFLTLKEVGEYNFSYKYAWVPGMMIIMLNQVWLPRLFEKGNAYFNKTFIRFSLLSLLITAALFMVIYKTLIFIQHYGYIPGQYRINEVFPVLGIAFIFYSGAHLIDSVLLLRKKAAFLSAVYAFVLAFNIAANFFAIPRYGVFGAAWITLLSFVLLWIILTLRVFLIHEERRIILAFTALFTAITFLAAGAVYLRFELPAALFFLIIIVFSLNKKITSEL